MSVTAPLPARLDVQRGVVQNEKRQGVNEPYQTELVEQHDHIRPATPIPGALSVRWKISMAQSPRLLR